MEIISIAKTKERFESIEKKHYIDEIIICHSVICESITFGSGTRDVTC